MLTNSAPGTSVYSNNDPIRTAEQARERVWDRFASVPMSKDLKDFLAKNREVNQLLETYGPTLPSLKELKSTQKRFKDLSSGELLSAAPEAVHAGPDFRHFRAVGFATARRRGQEPYDYNTQFTAWNVFMRVVSEAWDRPVRDRTYLLEVLAAYLLETPTHYGDLSRFCAGGAEESNGSKFIQDCCRVRSRKKRKVHLKRKDVTKLIEKAVQRDVFGF